MWLERASGVWEKDGLKKARVGVERLRFEKDRLSDKSGVPLIDSWLNLHLKVKRS